ncbi:MAG TPA: hypothetical protein VN623_07325 [Hyphomicrobium sp.]|jgi:ribulose kinase|uniref:hypothetical protein n=1 Tax=Hyphomicrobium sp. TaxID=82 RepID=UPI002BE64986|nr:hypothetical protein [Hyphomicrobium sp.]HXE01743.1 hypothetical protein [Hyphomicrobium sp.]
MTTFPRSASAIVAAVGAVAITSISGADATPVAKHAMTSSHSAVVKVQHDSRDDGWYDRHYRRYHHRHYRRGEVVDAPFTRVETGRHTVVDAPFAHVYSGRRGHHVVAPFVDLWVPR